MNLDVALSRGRAAAEARMTSVCLMRRLVRHPIDANGAASLWQIIQYDVPCRIPPSEGTREVEVAGTVQQAAVRQVHVPADTADLWRDGDVIDVVVGVNRGRAFRVLESAGSDQTTAHRMPCVEVPRLTDWG